MSWEDNLNEEERETWQRFVNHHREETLVAMTDSAVMVSIVPDPKDVDMKFSVELGMAIMLDKPIIAVVAPGVVVPNKLRRVADQVVICDIDTEEGQATFLRALDELGIEAMGGREDE